MTAIASTSTLLNSRRRRPRPCNSSLTSASLPNRSASSARKLGATVLELDADEMLPAENGRLCRRPMFNSIPIPIPIPNPMSTSLPSPL